MDRNAKSPTALLVTSLAEAIVEEISSHAPSGYEFVSCRVDAAIDEQVRLARTADFLILFPALLPTEILEDAPSLRLVQLLTAGFDRIDIERCRQLGIPLANNGGANAIDVAEHAIALMLAVYRRLVELDGDVRAGRTDRIDTGLTTCTLAGKTVGLVGMGNIGQRTAERLAGFGCALVYADTVPLAADRERELSLTRVDLDDLLAQADIVSLHVPLSDGTRGLIGSKELAAMPPHAVLINTCRGGVVDEPALTDALESGALRGAGLDVFAQEPPDTENPLLAMDNVVLTPHVAGVTRDTWVRRAQFAFENMERVWQGEEPLARIA